MKHLSRVLSTGIPQGYSGISPEGAVEIEPLICNFHSTYFDKKCLKPKYDTALCPVIKYTNQTKVPLNKGDLGGSNVPHSRAKCCIAFTLIQQALTRAWEKMITGAGSGLGRGTALSLVKKGHKVIACVQI